MSTNWNSISSQQLNQFLAQAGLTSLPDLSAISESELEILGGIIGEQEVEKLKTTKEKQESTLAAPQMTASTSTGDWSDTMAKIAELRAKMGDIQAKSAAVGIEADRDKMNKLNDAEQKRIQDMIHELQEAESTGTWQKILGWVGAGLGVVCAGLLTVATLGAALPALAIAVGMTVAMGLEEADVMDDVMEFLVKYHPVLGPLIANDIIDLEETAKWMKVAMNIAATIVKVAVEVTTSVAMMVVGIALAATPGAPAAPFFIFAGVVGILSACASLVAAGTQIASGFVGVHHANIMLDADNLQAESVENKAWLAKTQATISELMDRLDEIMQKMHDSVTNISDIFSSTAQTQHTIMTNMSS